MQTLLISAALILAAALPLSAIAEDHAGHGAPAAQSNTALADGLVKKVDKVSGRVTIAHGPLPDGMPAMTMVFRVQQAAWIDQLKEGDKIRFASAAVNGVLTVTRFERAK